MPNPTNEWFGNARLKGPQRLQVALTDAEMMELHQVAANAQTSPSVLAQTAIRQMLVQVRAGAVPFVPPADGEIANS